MDSRQTAATEGGQENKENKRNKGNKEDEIDKKNENKIFNIESKIYDQ